MRVYKTCLDGNCCIFYNLEDAKRMLISDIKCSENFTEKEYYEYEKEIKELTEKELEKENEELKKTTIKIYTFQIINEFVK